MNILNNLRKTAAIKKSNDIPSIDNARKKKKKGMSPWLHAPAALLGAAGLGGAYALGGDKRIDDMRSAITDSKKPYEPWETDLSRYVSLESQLANSSVLGIPSGSIMAAVRANPKLLSNFLPDEKPESFNWLNSNSVQNPLARLEAETHYSDFKKGPLAAYQHMLQPALRFGKDYHDLMMPHFLKTYQDALREKFKPTHTVPFTKDKAMVDITPPNPGLGWAQPIELGTETFSHPEQVAILKKYVETMTDAQKVTRRNREIAPTLGPQGAKYTAIADGLIGARQALKTVGMTAGGAAAGGLAGHYLHNLISGSDEKKKNSKLRYLLTSGAGAGLGAAAGAYFSPQEGKSLIGNSLMALLNKVKGTKSV